MSAPGPMRSSMTSPQGTRPRPTSRPLRPKSPEGIGYTRTLIAVSWGYESSYGDHWHPLAFFWSLTRTSRGSLRGQLSIVVTGREVGFVSLLELLACPTHYAAHGHRIGNVRERVMTCERAETRRASAIATPYISWWNRPIIKFISIPDNRGTKLMALAVENKIRIVIDPLCDP